LAWSGLAHGEGWNNLIEQGGFGGRQRVSPIAATTGRMKRFRSCAHRAGFEARGGSSDGSAVAISSRGSWSNGCAGVSCNVRRDRLASLGIESQRRPPRAEATPSGRSLAQQADPCGGSSGRKKPCARCACSSEREARGRHWATCSLHCGGGQSAKPQGHSRNASFFETSPVGHLSSALQSKLQEQIVNV